MDTKDRGQRKPGLAPQSPSAPSRPRCSGVAAVTRPRVGRDLRSRGRSGPRRGLAGERSPGNARRASPVPSPTRSRAIPPAAARAAPPRPLPAAIFSAARSLRRAGAGGHGGTARDSAAPARACSGAGRRPRAPVGPPRRRPALRAPRAGTYAEEPGVHLGSSASSGPRRAAVPACTARPSAVPGVERWGGARGWVGPGARSAGSPSAAC